MVFYSASQERMDCLGRACSDLLIFEFFVSLEFFVLKCFFFFGKYINALFQDGSAYDEP